MTTVDPAALEQLALGLLARREHSRDELYRKLAARSGDAELVEPLLDRLEAQGVLSNRRFAEAYVAARCRRGFGPVRITLELRERGVAPVLVDDALRVAGVDWQEQLAEVARCKFGVTPARDARERAQRARFLEYRGFPTEQIRDLLWD